MRPMRLQEKLQNISLALSQKKDIKEKDVKKTNIYGADSQAVVVGVRFYSH